MANIKTQNLDHFERLLKEDPKSKAFAPLAEGYRKNGELDKALRVALDGVAKNPNFNSGKVALAKVLIDLKKYEIAEKALIEVVESDFDNLLAHRLLGEIYIHLKDPMKALASYKSALLSNPLDEVSQKMVNKLESVSATSFDNKIFKSTLISPDTTVKTQDANLAAALSYLDALIARHQYPEAINYINDKLKRYPGNPELVKRSNYLHDLKSIQPRISKSEALAKPQVVNKKIEILKSILKNIDSEIQKRG